MAEQINALPFEYLCSLFEKLFKKKNNKVEQDTILLDFFMDLRIKTANRTMHENSSFFPILRLILPDKERVRCAYNMRENKLGALLVKVLSISKKSHDANKLTEFRAAKSSGDYDFASIAYFLLKNRVSRTNGSLTIGEINDILDKIAKAEVGNKGPILDEAFVYVIKNSTAQQIKWFLRIILKDLKLAIGYKRILAAFQPDAPEYYEHCGNLNKVCEDLDDGNTRPVELGLQIFHAISPMLSERLDVTRVTKLAQNKQYYIENKFDGERFQMHMEGGKFDYFSRKGFSYGDHYGRTYNSGNLTPFLKDSFSSSVTSIILDGEMMGWHKQNHYFSSKGVAFDVKKVTENSKFRPCFCVFDLLYYNGKSLVGPPDKGGVPLKERMKLLDTLFTDVPGVIQHSKRQLTNDNSHILDALNKAIEDQEEGIVIKDPDSYYICNKRMAGWYKIKPEYTEGTMDDLDLVIIGADEAENKKQGRAKSFHIACADTAVPGEVASRWVCVGRVATGITFEERERMSATLEKHWVSSKKTSPPPVLYFNKEIPDFWLLPEHSIVLQVRATELIRSTDFGTSYTLRFPRVVKIRDDKPVKDVMTLQEFNQLVDNKGPVIKLSTKRVNVDQIDENELKSRKVRTSKALKVSEQFRSKITDEIEIISKALSGRELCIRSDDDDCTKQELIRIIKMHGGKHVENIGPKTWCCVVGRPTYANNKLIESQTVDVVTTAWLRSLPVSETPCTLSPLDMLAITPETRLTLSLEYDSYGDSYTALTDEETLKKCFAKMDVDRNAEIYLTTAELLDIDKELFPDGNPYSYLRTCFIYYLGNNDILMLQAKMFGATFCDAVNPNITHVVLSNLAENIQQLKFEFKAVIVSEDWLESCILEGKIVSPTPFIM